MADLRSDPLTAYLTRAIDKRWAWGECDCFLFVADWVCERTGNDPAGKYRGAYTNEVEARHLIELMGGEVKFAEYCLARVGCVANALPKTGDVGLVRAAVGRNGDGFLFAKVGAICVKPGTWVIKPADGRQLAARNFPLIKAWSLPNGGNGRRHSP